MPPVGLAKDSGWQVGLRRTLPVVLEDAWDLLFSPAGLHAWLGELPGFRVGKDANFELPDGTRGKFTTYEKHSHVRLQWHPPGYPRHAIMQVRVIPTGVDKTVISFHQEHLPNEKARMDRKAFFKKAMGEIEVLIDRKTTKSNSNKDKVD
jgi:uncharacterized protein YndB with AHSA1/START domain